MLVRSALVMTRVSVFVFVVLITFRVSKMYIGHAHLSVCLSVLGRMPTLLCGPGCNLGVVGLSPSCALLGRFASNERVSLL